MGSPQFSPDRSANLRTVAYAASRPTKIDENQSHVPPPPPPDFGAADGVMVTCEAALTVASAADTAVTLTVVDPLTFVGGVYSPDEETVPTAVLPPAIPLTCQLTAVFAAFATYAANGCPVVPAWRVAAAGHTATITAGVTAAGRSVTRWTERLCSPRSG
jgi:hypothetical protein